MFKNKRKHTPPIQLERQNDEALRTLKAYGFINRRRRQSRCCQRQLWDRHIAARDCRAEALGTCQGVGARTHRAITSTVAARAAPTASFAAVTTLAYATYTLTAGGARAAV